MVRSTMKKQCACIQGERTSGLRLGWSGVNLHARPPCKEERFTFCGAKTEQARGEICSCFQKEQLALLCSCVNLTYNISPSASSTFYTFLCVHHPASNWKARSRLQDSFLSTLFPLVNPERYLRSLWNPCPQPWDFQHVSLPHALLCPQKL